jgi:hypothetical protein
MLAMETRKNITTFLKDIESDHSINVVYAADVGPISYGLEHKEIKPIIRFIYKHQDLEDHFVLKNQSTNFKAKNADFMAEGIYVTKAMSQLMRSEVDIFSVIQSGIIYKPNSIFYTGLAAAGLSFCPQSLAQSHLSKLNKLTKNSFTAGSLSTAGAYAEGIYHAMSIKWLMRSPQSRPLQNIQALLNRDESKEDIRKLMDDVMTHVKTAGIDSEYISPTLFNYLSWFPNWAPQVVARLETKPPNLNALRNLHYKTILG